tara:strand:- start:1118 stop:1330 length:213 start_codon:yes stop_codon:yes gene_type:complete
LAKVQPWPPQAGAFLALQLETLLESELGLSLGAFPPPLLGERLAAGGFRRFRFKLFSLLKEMDCRLQVPI